MADVMSDAFIDDLVAAAAGLALMFVGVPDMQMMGALYLVRAKLQADLEPIFGPDVAAVIAGSFVATVARRRAEIDPGAVSRAMN